MAISALTFAHRTALAASLVAAGIASPALANSAQHEAEPFLEAEEVTTTTEVMPDAGADIPAEYRSLPEEIETVERMTGPDGEIVETVVRTRRIERRAHMADPAMHDSYYSYPAAPEAIVLDRETWLAECEARTRGTSGRKKGGIIGGLLGAIAGGIIGNRAWDSERLAGTLIGAGTGGLAGGLIGSAIGSRDERSYYNCEEALDRYMSARPYHPRQASRTIAPHAYGYAPVMAYAPMYAYAPAYQQPVTMIEVREEIPQRAVVREYVTEEWVDEIEAPRAPATRMIKEAPRVRPVPVKQRPTKLIKGS